MCEIVYFIASLLLLSAGVATGWSSPSIPKLLDENSPIPTTSDESSWIVALFEIGVLIAGAPSAWIMDR